MGKKMSVRMERQNQYEEEQKEEPEAVKTGDTWTGPRSALRLRSVDLLSMEVVPHPVHHDIDLEKADQRGSETRRTEFSDQDREEWEEEPESGRAGDTRTGPRSASRRQHASTPLILGGSLSPAADDINNDTADQHRSETRRTDSSARGDGPFSPLISHRQDDSDFPDQPRTSNSKTKRRKLAPEYAGNVFGTWSAAAVWIMMALTVATSSLAGAECIGTEVKLDKGEAVLRCPLPVDASATRQGIIVKHFPTPDSADEVMHCDWPTKEAVEPKCESSDGFSLVGQLSDQVVAKVPVSRLMDSGAYKCQLYPPDYQRPFTPCHIRFSDNDEGSAVLPTSVVSSIATNGSTPGQDPLIREVPSCVSQSGSVELTAAVLVLQIIIVFLLGVNVLYLQNRKNLQGKDERMKAGWMAQNSAEEKPVKSEEPMNSLDEAVFIPEPTLYPSLLSHCISERLQPFPSQSCNLAAVGGLPSSN